MATSGDESVCPYPGLRSFRSDEADVFFGRESQVDAMMDRLARGRFLVVTGPSGCGKSSLVMAGLIPALRSGFLTAAGGSWDVALMRPGDRPFARLARALVEAGVFGPAEDEVPPIVEAGLRRGPLGLVELLRDRGPDGPPLLLVVDQFEELFRFGGLGRPDEASSFVDLLLASAGTSGVSVYVLLTMRSDYLGDCTRFRGLPEAINDGQFLTPRMSLGERRAAIESPAEVFGRKVEPDLVAALLNDLGDDPDQLPLMQHALMRLWRLADAAGRGTPPADAPEATPGAGVMTLADYHSIGGVSQALSGHADEAFASLDARGQELARVLFVALSERGPDGRDVRRPAPLAEVAEVGEATAEEVARVVDVFRRPGLNLLSPSHSVPLGPETALDISHESLIRQWHRLRQWIDREAEAARMYRRLEETARLWAEGKAGLWGFLDLRTALAWKRDHRPNAAWARRYLGDFDLAIRFLDESEQAERKRDRTTYYLGCSISLVFFACALAGAAYLVNLGWSFLRRFF